jgi:hypothetical protein
MSTTAAKQAGGVEKVKGGTVVNAGTPASDSPITKTLNLNDLKTGSEYGSEVVANEGGSTPHFTDPAGVQKVKSGGTGGLAYFPNHQAGDRNFIIKGAGDSAAKINNDATTLLTVPGAEYDGVGRDQIHAIFDTRQRGTYATASFNVLATPGSGVVPGRTIGTSAGSEQNFVATSGDFSYDVDDAATPTRAIPGELTYHFGGLGRPTTDQYKARDANES